MTIKNLLKGVATLLNERQVVEYIESNDALIESEGEGYKNTCTLLYLFNFVLREIFSKYKRVETREQLLSTTKRVYFNSLKKIPIEIKNIYNKNWEPIEYEIFASYVDTQQDAFGISYVYVPREYKYTGDFEVEEMFVPISAIMYCVAREFCLTLNRFEESVFWHQKFIDVLSIEQPKPEEEKKDDADADREQEEEKPLKEVKNYTIKERSWI